LELFHILNIFPTPSHDQHTKEANKALHKEIDVSFSIQTIQIMPLETS
jgi:hypothetical protein